MQLRAMNASNAPVYVSFTINGVLVILENETRLN